MIKTFYMVATCAVAALIAGCGGGDGNGAPGTAGVTTLKAGDLDGSFTCVGGPYSFSFLTTGLCTDNQILQDTCTRKVTISGLKYFDYPGTTGSTLTLNTGITQGPDTKPYYFGKTNFGDRLIYERYIPVLRAGTKIGVAVNADAISSTSGTEYSLDGNGDLLVSFYDPKALPRDLTYSKESGGPGQIEVTTHTCRRVK
jgi:hypothetical protein